MSGLKTQRRTVPAWWETVGIIALLAVIIWVARYWYSARFGLYEDDYTIIPAAIHMNGSQLFGFIWNYIIHLYGHARPLSDSYIYLFSNIGWKLDGLFGIYWIGFAFVTLNACLFYWLLRRLHSRSFALIGALAYCLFSADTTQAFLTHSLGLQPSLTLLLLAFHSFLSNKHWLSYLFALVLLFSYETPFPLLFVAPLLQLDWDKNLVKKLVKHILILGVILLGVFLLRFFVGEKRVASLGVTSAIITAVLHMIEGPIVSLGSYFYRPIQLLRNLDLPKVILVVIVFAGLSLVFMRLKSENSIELRGLISSIKSRKPLAELPAEVITLLKLAAVGLAMLVLAYPLTLTVRAYAISGRDTRVHLAAVIGASFIWACLGTFFFEAMAASRKKLIGVFILAGFFGLLTGYGFVIQNDYQLAWQYQREFWSRVLPLIPDVQDGVAVIVEPSAFKDTRQIGANSWNLPRLLAGIYNFPDNWTNPPSVYRLIPGWQKNLISPEGQVQLNAGTTNAAASLFETYKSENVILIESNGKMLTRSSSPMQINGQELNLKALAPPGTPPFSRGYLYSFLIQDANP